MKAHFILKWRTGADGQQEAKARAARLPRPRCVGQTSGDDLANRFPAGEPDTAPRLRTGRPPWQVYKQRFLQGTAREADLYVHFSVDAVAVLGIAHLKCLKLLMPMYGPVDALREWFLVARGRLGRWFRGASVRPLPAHTLRHARGITWHDVSAR